MNELTNIAPIIGAHHEPTHPSLDQPEQQRREQIVRIHANSPAEGLAKVQELAFKLPGRTGQFRATYSHDRSQLEVVAHVLEM